MSDNKHITVALMSVSRIMLDETTKEIIETLMTNGTDSSNIFVTDTSCDGQSFANTIDILNPNPKAIEALLMVELPEEVDISLGIIPESKLKC